MNPFPRGDPWHYEFRWYSKFNYVAFHADPYALARQSVRSSSIRVSWRCLSVDKAEDTLFSAVRATSTALGSALPVELLV